MLYTCHLVFLHFHFVAEIVIQPRRSIYNAIVKRKRQFGNNNNDFSKLVLGMKIFYFIKKYLFFEFRFLLPQVFETSNSKMNFPTMCIHFN